MGWHCAAADHTTSKPLLQTDVVSITPILLRVPPAPLPSTSSPPEPDAKIGSGGDDDGPVAKRQRTEAAVEEPRGDSQGRQRPMGLSEPDVTVYAIQLAGRPGKFLPEKAIELGVQPGPVSAPEDGRGKSGRV